MDLSSILITISIPLLLSIFGAIMTWQNYKINKKKDAGADLEKEKENEARMVRIEADVSYIRLAVDKTEERLNKNKEDIEMLKQEVEVIKSNLDNNRK